MRPLRVRRAVPADQAALMPLVAQLHEHEGIPTDARTEQALQGLLADPRLGFVVLAEPQGPVPGLVGYAVVGFGYSLEFAGRDAFVDELFVLPDSRGLGIGALLLGAIERECLAEKVAALHLEVEHANQDAKRLYERNAYEAHKRHLMTKWVGPRPGDAKP